VETDPLNPRYDPVLLRILGVPYAQIFESEVRNPQWAPGMESGAGSQLMSDLTAMFPELTDLRMECRSRTCFLTWKSVGADIDRRVYTASRVTHFSPGASNLELQGARAGVYMSFRPVENFPVEQQAHGVRDLWDVSDPARFAETFARKRAKTYARLRSGERPLPSPIKGMKVPER
jgi:hypothetical protein